jgi:hypothetical protein
VQQDRNGFFKKVSPEREINGLVEVVLVGVHLQEKYPELARICIFVNS